LELQHCGTGSDRSQHRGKQGLYELAQKAMATMSSTFVEDVLANDQHGMVLALHRFTRDGQQQEYRTVHVYEIRDGKLAACWEHPRDQAFDASWGPRIEARGSKDKPSRRGVSFLSRLLFRSAVH
jgi:hypothetical protein